MKNKKNLTIFLILFGLVLTILVILNFNTVVNTLVHANAVVLFGLIVFAFFLFGCLLIGVTSFIIGSFFLSLKSYYLISLILIICFIIGAIFQIVPLLSIGFLGLIIKYLCFLAYAVAEL